MYYNLYQKNILIVLTMKTTALLTLTLLLNISTFAYNPKTEIFETQDVQQIEMKEILNKVLDVDENSFISQLEKKNRVIIIDKNFNKIGEETVNSLEDINSL